MNKENNMPIRRTNFTASRLRLALTDSKLSLSGIQLIYGLSIGVWLFFTYFLNLWVDTSWTTKAFLALPIAVGVSNILTPVHGSDIELDPQVTQGNLLSYILIAGSILSPWLSRLTKRRRWHHTRVIKVFVVMVLLLTLSQFDFFSLRYVSDIEVHTSTIINTYALSLVGYAISEFFHTEYRIISTWAPKPVYHREEKRVGGSDYYYNEDDFDVDTEPSQEEIMNKSVLIAGSQLDNVRSTAALTPAPVI